MSEAQQLQLFWKKNIYIFFTNPGKKIWNAQGNITIFINYFLLSNTLFVTLISLEVKSVNLYEYTRHGPKA